MNAIQQVKLLETDNVFISPNIDFLNDDRYAALFHLNQDYLVTKHSLEKFMERAPTSERLRNIKNLDVPERALKALFRQFKSSFKVRRENNLMALLNNHVREADYYFNQEFIYIVEMKRILKTCYPKSAESTNYVHLPEIIHP
jgi:hypothetical protein